VRAPKIRRRRASERLRRGIFIIPSLFTVGNIFCGFVSVIASSSDHLQRAAVLILIAIIADILDGRIARLTGATSSFGEVYDSLADVISFGVAPAMLAFHWGLSQVPRLGMAVAFLYLVAGSIRLARFSTKVHDSSRFVGLPIPGGAAAIAVLVLTSPSPVSHPAFIPVVACFVLCLALLMVSNLPYRSFKDFNLRKPWPAPTLFGIALLFTLIALRPKEVLSILAAAYVLSAPTALVFKRLLPRSRAALTIAESEGTTDADTPNEEDPHP
jgi:CDP-diacylglycerol--serine O-phosphatidyltransferase